MENAPSDVSACALSARSIGSGAPSIITLSGRNAGSSAPVTPTARYGSSTTRPVHSGSAPSTVSVCTASSGSACTSGSLDPSHVLLAIGRPHDVAHGSLRLSLCEWNTDEEIDRILDAVPEVVEYLRGMSPLWKDLVSGKKPFTL